MRIDRFTSRIHAELACSMLVAHGLNARVSGDDVAGVHPDIPYGIGGTAVVVPEEQLEEANALLDEEFDGPLVDPDADPDPAADADAGPDVRAGTGAGDTDDGDDDGSWVSSGRTADRRPGLRTFALLAAIGMLIVFFIVAFGAGASWAG